MLFSNFHYHNKPIDFNQPVIAFMHVSKNTYAFNKENGICITGFENELIRKEVSPFVIRIDIDEHFNIKCLSPEFKLAYNAIQKEHGTLFEVMQFQDIDDFLTKTIRMSLNGTPASFDNHTISYQIENESILALLKKAPKQNNKIDHNNEFYDRIKSSLENNISEITSDLLFSILSKKTNQSEEYQSHIDYLFKMVLRLDQVTSCIFNPTLLLIEKIQKEVTPIIEKLHNDIQENKSIDKDGSILLIKDIVRKHFNNTQYLKDGFIYSTKIEFQQTLLKTVEQQHNAIRLKQALFA